MDPRNLRWYKGGAPLCSGRYLVMLKVDYGLKLGQASYLQHQWCGVPAAAEVVAYSSLAAAEKNKALALATF